MSEERLNELFSIVNEGYSSIQELEIRDYITNLQQKVEQLENIRKELPSTKIIINSVLPVAEKAIEKVNESNTKEGGKSDAKKKTTRGRKSTRTV